MTRDCRLQSELVPTEPAPAETAVCGHIIIARAHRSRTCAIPGARESSSLRWDPNRRPLATRPARARVRALREPAIVQSRTVLAGLRQSLQLVLFAPLTDFAYWSRRRSTRARSEFSPSGHDPSSPRVGTTRLVPTPATIAACCRWDRRGEPSPPGF